MDIKRPAQLLVPIAPEVVLYWLISLFLLGLGTINELVSLIFGEQRVEWQTLVNTTLAQRWNLVQTTTPKLGTVAIMVFWSLVGTVVYTFIWSSANVSGQVKDEIEAGSTHFIHPKTWTAKQYWLDIVRQSLLQAITCFILIGLTIGTIWIIYPFSVELFRPLLVGGSITHTGPMALLALLILSLVMYIGGILIRILLRRAY